MRDGYILAIDQGTSGTKAIIFDSQGQWVTKATEPLTSYYPKPGWVEQDPMEIYQSVLAAVRTCLADFKGDLSDIVSCGVSNQRETFCLWDETGQPLHPAVVWQCKRSVEVCNRLMESGLENEIARRTGLRIDPYFSGTKVLWLYQNVPGIREAIEADRAYFGTIDTWLLYRLTRGKRYFTDYTNASRTLFFNLDTLTWDVELLTRFGLQALHLPEARPSSFSYGASDFEGLFSEPLSISAMIGDSHAAAFGEGCSLPGTAKATMGTGCSILLNTGSNRIASNTGMVTTLCWSTSDRVDYALEGIIVTCGATITWLRDQLGLFGRSAQTEAMANALDDNQGVYLVPAFSGLGAPHWQMQVKAAVMGLTLGCDGRHLARAALESIPYQIKDIIDAMEADSGVALQELKVDGGLTENTFVMQFLANLLGVNVVTIGHPDVTAWGAAMLAGLERGVYESVEALRELGISHGRFEPTSTRARQTEAIGYQGWRQAVRTVITGLQPGVSSTAGKSVGYRKECIDHEGDS